jgi:hypothetical protein
MNLQLKRDCFNSTAVPGSLAEARPANLDNHFVARRNFDALQVMGVTG